MFLESAAQFHGAGHYPAYLICESTAKFRRKF
jgi:hypothetical protein